MARVLCTEGSRNEGRVAPQPVFRRSASLATVVHSLWVLGFVSFYVTLICPWLAAATFFVTNTEDSTPGSLRAAVAAADANGGGDVVIPPSVEGTTILGAGEIAISSDLRIIGPGPDKFAVSGNGVSRVFRIASSAKVSISDITIREGVPAQSGASGGGIYNEGTLSVTNCVVTNNHGSTGDGSAPAGGNGGGIFNVGILTLYRSSVVGNSGGRSADDLRTPGGSGGGICNARGLLTIEACFFGNNSGGLGSFGTGAGTGGAGGAIYNEGPAEMRVYDSVFQNNSAGPGNNAFVGGGDGGAGGCIWNAGTAKLVQCTITNNFAGSGGAGDFGGAGGDGGGFHNSGTLILEYCTISGNVAGSAGWAGFYDGNSGGSGGGFYTMGSLTLSNCAVYRNGAGQGGVGGSVGVSSRYGGPGGNGGAVCALGGLVIVVNSTISENQSGNGGRAGSPFNPLPVSRSGGSGGSGGGIYSIDTSLMIGNCTVGRNSTGMGGAGTLDPPGPAGNPGDGGGIWRGGTNTAELLMTIVAINAAAGIGPDVAGDFVSLGHNLIANDTASGGLGSEGDLLNIDPKLGPLQFNGGSTWTHALMPESPAINAGTLTGAPPADQRGVIRPQGGAVDIGAYEYAQPVLIFSRTDKLILDAPTGLTYRVDYRESFLPSTPWSTWTNVTLTKTPLCLILPPLTNNSGFFRAVSETNR